MYERFYAQITDFIFVEQKPEKADILFVPGSGFPQIAEKAARLYALGYAPWVLPSGRYSIKTKRFSGVQKRKDIYQKDYETEWEFLQDVLQKNQVPKEAIIKEDQATYTYENAIYSKAAAKRAGITVDKAIICCKPHHARRCLLYYQLLFPDTKLLVCPAEDCEITKQNWYHTKEGCAAVLGELERCGGQFHEILAELREKHNQ